MFGRRKDINSAEYEDLMKKIVACVVDIQELKARADHTADLLSSLRGLVNRKLNPEKDDTETDKNEAFL